MPLDSSSATTSASPPFGYGNTRLTVAEKVGYGLGDTASNLYWKTIEFFLLIFYTDIYGLSAKSVAVLFLVTRLWDALSDPIVGYLADRTRTRWGRFRPYLIWMSIPLAVTATFMFYVPNLSGNGKLVYAFITYALVMTAYTAINTPYGALMGVISPRSSERTSVSTYRFVAAFAGAILVQYFTLDLVDWFGSTEQVNAEGTMETIVDQSRGFHRTIMLYGVVSVALFFVAFATTRERVLPTNERSTTLWQDIRFLMSSCRLHQILLVSILLAIGLTAELQWRHLVWMTMIYFGASLISWVVAVGIRKRFRLESTASSFQQDFHDLLRNGPWMTLFVYGLLLLISGFVRNSAIVYYFKYCTNEPGWVSLFLVFGSVASIIGMLFAGPLALRFGKARVLMSTNLLAAFFTSVFFFIDPDDFVMMFVLHGIASLLMGPVAVLLWAMYADAADYSEWKTHRRATGLIFSAATFSQKLGCSIGAAAAAWLLSGFGYVAPIEGVEVIQSETTITGIRMMVSFMPGALLVMAAASLYFYAIDAKLISRIEIDLNER